MHSMLAFQLHVPLSRTTFSKHACLLLAFFTKNHLDTHLDGYIALSYPYHVYLSHHMIKGSLVENSHHTSLTSLTSDMTHHSHHSHHTSHLGSHLAAFGDVAVPLFGAGTCGDVAVSLFVAFAMLGDVGASLIVTGATFGDVAVSLFCGRGNCWSVTYRDRGHIW